LRSGNYAPAEKDGKTGRLVKGKHACWAEAKEKLLFANKNRKNFVNLGRAGFAATGQSSQSLCAAFLFLA
jgi:hypothetical protein